MSCDERIDIVDQNNLVLRTAMKNEAHRHGWLHRTVIAKVIGSDGHWTLVKQAADRQDAGQLVSPVGGHVKAGELPEDAVRREAAEEYGLTENFSFKHVGDTIFYREINGKKENHVFMV